jgi:hypothetical protein
MEPAGLTKLNFDAKRLEGSVLSAVTQDTESKTVLLSFKHWEGHSVSVACRDVIHCNISADGLSGDSEVIGASLRCLEGCILDHLREYGYLWRLESEQAKIMQGSWFHFSVDGDTCAVVICKHIGFV